MDCSLPGSSICGIFQASVLEWVAISFSRGSSWPRDQIQVSCIAGRCFIIWATREARLWIRWLLEQKKEDVINMSAWLSILDNAGHTCVMSGNTILGIWRPWQWPQPWGLSWTVLVSTGKYSLGGDWMTKPEWWLMNPIKTCVLLACIIWVLFSFLFSDSEILLLHQVKL